MRTEFIIAAILTCGALAATSGCKKEQPAAETQPPKASDTITPAPTGPITEPAVAPAAGPTVTKVLQTPKAASQEGAAPAQLAEQQAQGLIERAEGLVADGRYQDALSSLNELKTAQLSAGQQKLVDDLKARIQATLAKTAAGDAPSLPGGEK